MGQFLKANWPWIVGPIMLVLGRLLWLVSTQDGAVADFDYTIR